MRCQRLRQMTVLIRKFDHPAGEGITSTIFFDIPGMNDKLFKMEKFLIRMTGKKRLAALRKSWEGEHKPRWEEQFRPGAYIYQDPMRGERWLRMELADGPVGPCPDRVLSEDDYWYDRNGELLGSAGSSMDEDGSDSEDDEDSEDEEDPDDEDDLDDEANWEDVE
ncbi:hypothetical protein FIBSPDRAFT_875931 [Athelia psychrophila]|uniref:Uncharacterized protein n=1 Tax=Athelia psychrophila TaxID=1759441 RepID=A0A167XCN8_9AGAM|nr:hypothetical protein FIBSPDRAFT_875931 [Fibularhizoctonia sp. CBS 109695]